MFAGAGTPSIKPFRVLVDNLTFYIKNMDNLFLPFFLINTTGIIIYVNVRGSFYSTYESKRARSNY